MATEAKRLTHTEEAERVYALLITAREALFGLRKAFGDVYDPGDRPPNYNEKFDPRDLLLLEGMARYLRIELGAADAELGQVEERLEDARHDYSEAALGGVEGMDMEGDPLYFAPFSGS